MVIGDVDAGGGDAGSSFDAGSSLDAGQEQASDAPMGPFDAPGADGAFDVLFDASPPDARVEEFDVSPDTVAADAPPSADTRIPDATADAGPPDVSLDPPLPSCTAKLAWNAEFDVNPTTFDGNGDGTADWIMDRGAAFNPATLMGGQWRPTGGSILDTRPLHPFDARTLVFARMQNLSVNLNQFPAWGAIVWANLMNYSPQMMAVALFLRHEPTGGQTLTLYMRSGPEVARWEGLPDRPIDVALDLDPIARTARVWIDGAYRGQWPIPLVNQVMDEFATVATFGGPSVFDHARFTVCQ